MKKVHLLIILMTALFSCQKTEKMKDKLFPERPYEDAKIDKFYWADSGWDYTMIPLIKPYHLQQLQGSTIWMLDSHNPAPQIETFHGKNIVLNNFNPVEMLNVKDIYIYGNQGEKLNFDQTSTLSRIWFVINTKTKEVKGFELENDFKAELKKLNLPETFLNPDEIYEQYKQNPILPWFPENIKKQLEEVKVKQGK